METGTRQPSMAAEEQQTPSSSTDSRMALSPGSPGTHGSPQPRNQKACDSCRSRKVKCRFNDGATVCFVCASLEIPCTFDRPRKKRGPPNKHAEAIRSAMASQTTGSAESRSPSELRTLVLAERPVLGSPWLDRFAPMATIEQLLGEWFRHVHPVSPLLHRQRFMHRLRRGDADSDRFFCGLVISVCAATVATLRRSSGEPVTVQYCVEFVRRHGLLQRDLLEPEFQLDWCIAMYNLGSAHGSTAAVDDAAAYHMGCEAVAGVRFLACYRLDKMIMLEQQQLKRLFLLLLAWSCSADLFGRVSLPMFLCDEPLHQLMPLGLTDEQLDPDMAGVAPLCADSPRWPGDRVSYVPGLVALSELFLVWRDAQQRQPVPAGERDVWLARHLAAIQNILHRLPAELRWRGGLSRPPHATEGHDVQVANIYVTSLHLRSNLLQSLGVVDGAEHGRILDDMLEILDHMPDTIFEANGSSIVPKIRDVGAAYFEQLRTGQNSTATAWHGDAVAREKLNRLLLKLKDLDLWPGMTLPSNIPRPGSSREGGQMER